TTIHLPVRKSDKIAPVFAQRASGDNMRLHAWLLSLTSRAGTAGSTMAAEPQKLTLLTFNMWGAGANASKSIEETVAVMKASGADIIGAQETVPEPDPCTAEVCLATDKSRAKEIAAAL